MNTHVDLPNYTGNAGKFLQVNETENDTQWEDIGVLGQAYRTIESNGTPEVQRSILNFSTLFTVADDVGNLSTDVTLNITNVAAALIADATFLEDIANSSTFVSTLIANATFITDLSSNTTFVEAIANNSNFVSTLIANSTFITDLSSNTTFVEAIANNSNFVSTLVANSTFITDLSSNTTFVEAIANNSNFITTLSSNTTFINDLSANSTFISNITTIVTTGGGVLFQNNGTDNSSQAVLNLSAGPNITLTDLGGGEIEISSSAAVFGTWDTTSYANGGTYQAPSDGFVVLFAQYTGGGTGSFAASILSDSASTPTTLRASDGHSLVASAIVTIIAPVKKNDYFKANATGTSIAGTVNFLPL